MAAAAAAAAASSASATVYGAARIAPSARTSFHVASALPPLQRRSSLSLSASTVPESQRFSSLKFKASSSSEGSGSVGEDDAFSNLKGQWDTVENKSTLLIYGGGAIVAVWLSSIVVGAINSVPLLPKIMELIGLGYTGWFVYRYILYKSSRKELAEEVDLLKKKITGTD